MFAYIKDVAHFVVVSCFTGGEGNEDIGGSGGGCASAVILSVFLDLLFLLTATPAFRFARSFFLCLVFVWLKNCLSGSFQGDGRCILCFCT